MESSVVEVTSRRKSMAADGSMPESEVEVSKKSSTNGNVTLYIGQRSFFDFKGKGNTIDGLVNLNLDAIEASKKVFVQVLASFKYGREDRDILGVNFQKDLFLSSKQLHPNPMVESHPKTTRLQERIMRRTTNATSFPFWFDLPTNTPVSVTVQPADAGEEEGEEQLPCGVQYEIRVYAADHEGAKAVKGSSVTMLIRRFNGLPIPPRPIKPAEITENFRFMMSDGSLSVTAGLDKEIYLHGEPLEVAVKMQNDSTKSVRSLEIVIRQIAEICLSETVKYKHNVETVSVTEGFPIEMGESLEKSFIVKCGVKDTQGLAIDGLLKKEKPNLAASTIIQHQFGSRENLGIIISYQVKVKMIMSMAQNVSIEIPFILTHMPNFQIRHDFKT